MKKIIVALTLSILAVFSNETNAATCRLTHSVPQPIADQSLISINFDSTEKDTFPADCHDEAIFTHYIMTQQAGCYIGVVQVTFSANDFGDRLVTVFAKPNMLAPVSPSMPIAAVTQKATGSGQPTRVNVSFNYCHEVSSPQIIGGIYVQAYQTSGSTLNISKGTDYTPIFWAVKID